MRSPSIDPKRYISPKSGYKAKIEVPTSKSRANRLLFLAAIDQREITLEGMPNSSDVEDMLRCLNVIGLQVERMGPDVIVIKNSFPACESGSSEPVVVKCGYGGTTTRFLSALLALGSKRYYIEAQGHMRERPMDEIIDSFEQLGVEAKLKSSEAWLVIQGPVKNKLASLKVDSSRSTQFASALAMCASNWGGEVVPIGVKASEDYFTMTLDCIENSKENTIWHVPADFSSLSYPIALAAIDGEVNVTNVHSLDKYQPDSILAEILKKMGAFVELSSNGLIVKKAELKAWSGDCANFPDLVPTLALLCSYAKGESLLENLEVLKHKESDRLSEIVKILKKFNVNVVASDSFLKITGPTERVQKAEEYMAPDDHRMIMITAIFMRLCGGGEVENWEHIRKSYTTFFEDVIDYD